MVGKEVATSYEIKYIETSPGKIQEQIEKFLFVFSGMCKLNNCKLQMTNYELQITKWKI